MWQNIVILLILAVAGVLILRRLRPRAAKGTAPCCDGDCGMCRECLGTRKLRPYSEIIKRDAQNGPLPKGGAGRAH